MSKKRKPHPEYAEKVRYAGSKLVVHAHAHLDAAIEARGVPVTELARRVGVSRQYLHDVLNGEKKLSLTTMGKLAGALDLVWGLKLHEFENRAFSPEGIPFQVPPGPKLVVGGSTNTHTRGSRFLEQTVSIKFGTE